MHVSFKVLKKTEYYKIINDVSRIELTDRQFLKNVSYTM